MSDHDPAPSHNYAYNPIVANWVQSTSLATQLHAHGAPDEPLQLEASPDDYYRYPPSQPEYTQSPHPHADQMTSVQRPRQASNGALGTARPPFRAGIAPSHPASRSSPQLPINRPTVKSLAQKFNQPETSPPTRARAVRPSPPTRSTSDSLATAPTARTSREVSYGPHKFTNLKPRERPQPAPASPASTRRTNGDRKSVDDQASSAASTSTRRRPSAVRKDSYASQASTTSAQGRRPFFGEVIGEYDAAMPGFGIPVLDTSAPREAEPGTPTREHDAASVAVTNDSHLSPRSIRSVRSPIETHVSPKSSHSVQSPPIRHRRSPSHSHFQQQPRESPEVRAPRSRSRASRIPVSTRRLSTTSDSSSSNRSYKASSARPPGSYKRAPSQQRSPGLQEGLPSIQSKLPATALPSSSYRDYRERVKGSKAANASSSLAAVITDTTKNGPPSPRLRNSRERQLLSQPGSPKLSPSHESPADASVNGLDPKSSGELLSPKRFEPNASKVFYHVVESNAPTPPSREPTPIAIDVLQSAELAQVDGPAEMAHHQEPLTLKTSDLAPPQIPAPVSVTTDLDFEESPVLGMPGGFMMTPPAHETPRIGTTEENQTTPGRRSNTDSKEATPRSQKETSGAELLQPVAFQPVKPVDRLSPVPPSPFAEGLRVLNQEDGDSYFPHSELGSVLGFRESIPIMLGSEAPSPGFSQLERVPERPSPRLSIGSQSYRAEPLDASGTIPYLEEEDSPILRVPNRQTLGPDDSASNVAMFNPAAWRAELPSMPEMLDKRGGLTFDSEAYSVINKVLNIYSKSPRITAEVAHESRQRIQQVSPLLAQHADWGSKESTEAYLARLLTDANGAEQPRAEERGSQADQEPAKDGANVHRPIPTYHELELDPIEPYSGGTAIILPSESRRYSRGSHSSVATTIHDEGGRPDNSSGARARDRSPEGAPQRLHAATYVPAPPPKDSTLSPRSGQAPHAGQEQAQAGFGPLLPEIRTSGEGLGLGLHAGQQQHHLRQPRKQHPTRPPIPNCQPPPSPAASVHAPAGAAPYTPSVYSQQPQSSVIPSAPLVTQSARGGKSKMCLTPGAPHPNNHGYAVHVEGAGIDSGVARENYHPDPQRLAPPRSARSSKAGSSHESITLAGSDRGSFAKSEGTGGSSNASGFNTPIDMSAGMDGACSSKTSQASRSPDAPRTPELPHHAAAFPNETDEAIERRLRHRYRILEELHCTEGAYMSDLMVISQIWMATASETFSPQEQSVVFSNIPDLEALATQLAIDLKAAVDPIRTYKEEDQGMSPEELEEAFRSIHEPVPGLGDRYEPEDHEQPEEEPEEHEERKEPKEKEKAPTPRAEEQPAAERTDIFDNCTLDNDDKTSVGYVIKSYLTAIEETYTKYLLNHDKANKIIVDRAKMQDGPFVGWQLACHEHSKDITDAWDLDSLLVKPVQRLMKYPLLLQSLQDVTPPTHDDYEDIVAARKGIVDINVRINDKKKRLETLRQATKEGKKGKKKGFPGIDIVRALGGKEKLKLVACEQFVDPVYDEHSQKFGGHFFQIQILINDFEKYRDELTGCFVHLNIVALHIVALLEDQQSSHPEVESAWRHHAMALLELRNVLLEDHKKAVSEKVLTPLHKLWDLYVRPQKLLEQRKKGLVQYMKYKSMVEKKEKVEPKLEDAADQFMAVNDALKDELPTLYALSKRVVQMIFRGFILYQKNWWKNCQKKMLPLLETEPEHTDDFSADMADYVSRFKSDWSSVQALVEGLDICNGNLVASMANFQSPHVSSMYESETASRKSTSRRTESISSEMSMPPPGAHGHRRSQGYTASASQRSIPSFEGPPRSSPHNGLMTAYQAVAEASSAWEVPAPSSSTPTINAGPGPGSSRSSARNMQMNSDTNTPREPHQHQRALSPASERSDATLTKTPTHSSGHSHASSLIPFPPLEDVLHGPSAPAGPSHDASSIHSGHLSASYRSPSQGHTFMPGSYPGSARGSTVFNSALPMSESPTADRSVEELPGTPADPDEPEVLFLAASLFEFNIAHDRREGGIPYLVYVPGEIFDVIGMKGELWLARNQDDPSRTVGWIWEKHFARILPEDS